MRQHRWKHLHDVWGKSEYVVELEPERSEWGWRLSAPLVMPPGFSLLAMTGRGTALQAVSTSSRVRFLFRLTSGSPVYGVRRKGQNCKGVETGSQ